MDESTFFKELGKRIKATREAKGLSGVELAHRCDFDKSNLGRIENGRTKPTITTLIKICRVLEVDLSNIFQGIKLPNNELADG